MKPSEKKPETVYRIIDRKDGEPVGSYSRACHDEFDFKSVDEARNANFHGMFRNKDKYKIAKYRVTYELIEDDVDGNPEQPKTDNVREHISLGIPIDTKKILESPDTNVVMEFLDREFKKIIYGLHKDGYINFNPDGKRRET